MKKPLVALSLFLVAALCAAEVIEIDVNTRETTMVDTSSDSTGYDAWNESPDLTGVKITGHEGEDASGSMSPRDLMLRAFGRLPAEEQARMGFTSLLEAAAATGTEVPLQDLQALWQVRQDELQEAADAISNTAHRLTSFIGDLQTSSGSPFDTKGALAVLATLEDELSDLDNARVMSAEHLKCAP